MTSQHDKAKRWRFGLWKLWAMVTCVCLLLGARSVRTELLNAKSRLIEAAWFRAAEEWQQPTVERWGAQIRLELLETLDEVEPEYFRAIIDTL